MGILDGPHMPKAKSRGKKKKTAPRKRALRSVENPGWLREDPDGRAPKPPARTKASLLPFNELKWEDFERLCLRLSERRANVEAAWSYGKSGHAQLGIDILVRMPDVTFHVWQSKRYKVISKSAVIKAIRFFLKHKWSKQATRFVLAVACEFKSPGVVEAIEEGRTDLRAKNIEFEALDASKLTERLRTEPELVDDFFERPWVKVICPPEALERLKNRLSRFEVATLRKRLQSFYSSWISAVDPGLPIVGQDTQGRMQATIPITERYIQPDLLFQVANQKSLRAATNLRKQSKERERKPSRGKGSSPSMSHSLSGQPCASVAFLSTSI